MIDNSSDEGINPSNCQKQGRMLQKQATWLDLTSGKTLNSSVRKLLAEENDVAANAAATSGDGGESAEVARHDVGLSEQCQGPDAE